MIIQYVKFFMNGMFIAVVAWSLQQFIYHFSDDHSNLDYAFASSATLVPLIFLNFCIQSKFIFSQSGQMWRFIVVDIVILFLVTTMAPVCKELIDQLLGPPWGIKIGFMLAALFASIPSYLIRYYWVFHEVEPTESKASNEELSQ